MKTIITLLAFVFWIFGKASAQPSQSLFGTDSTKWHVNYDYSLAMGYKSFIAIKPFIHNNKQYQKASIGTWGLHTFYLTEDTINGKVWASKHPDSTQHLVMDFSLNTGDTFSLFTGGNSESKVIVDSTKMINDKKWIYLSDKNILGQHVFKPNQIFYFIEGIGTNYSYMMTIANEGYGFDYLICAYKDGVEQTDYQNTAFNGSCDITNVSTKDITTTKVQLYPNPINDLLHIEHLPTTPHTISIFDILGRKIFNIENTESNYSMNMQDFAVGTYIVKITIKDKATQSFRVVKH